MTSVRPWAAQPREGKGHSKIVTLSCFRDPPRAPPAPPKPAPSPPHLEVDDWRGLQEGEKGKEGEEGLSRGR